MHIMCFDEIYASISSPTLSTTVSSKAEVLLLKITRSTQCCWYERGCGALYWSLASFSGCIPKKSDAPSRSLHLPVVFFFLSCPPLIHAKIPSDFSCANTVYTVTEAEFLPETGLLCLENLVLLQPPTTFGSYALSAPSSAMTFEPLEGGMI